MKPAGGSVGEFLQDCPRPSCLFICQFRMMSRAVQETGTSPSQELHTGRRSLPMSVDVDIQKSIDVFDLHLGDIVVTSITQYEEPSDQSPPSTAEGVVAAVEALPATVKVREAPGINQSSSPLTVLVEPRQSSKCDIASQTNQTAAVTIRKKPEKY